MEELALITTALIVAGLLSAVTIYFGGGWLLQHIWKRRPHHRRIRGPHI